MKKKFLRVILLSISLSTFNFQFSTCDAQAPPADFDSLFRAQPPFHESWDTRNLFAYRSGGGDDVPAEVEITLSDSLGRGFCAPVVGQVFSHYGIRGRRRHQGTDIRVALGQPIHAAWDGVVRYSDWNSGGFGNIVIVRHASGLETYYSHLSKRLVTVGQRVEAGDVIGLGGRTGRASALHLHFEVRWHDRSFDAERLIDFRTGALLAHTFVLRREYFAPTATANRATQKEHAGDSLLMASTAAASARKDTVKLVSREVGVGGEVGVDDAAAAAVDQPAAVYHTIRSGDTLWTLARRNGTTVAALCALNNISKTAKLKIGRRLRIK